MAKGINDRGLDVGLMNRLYLITTRASLVIEAEDEEEAAKKFESGCFEFNEVELSDDYSIELF